MERDHWNPPGWLVWYGYGMAAVWAIPARTPAHNPIQDDLARFSPGKVDKAVQRLISRTALQANE